jgi:elongation factor Ts
MTIPVDKVKELRARTGAGVVDAKEALQQSGGDVDKAIAWLREQGKATAAKKADRDTSEGVVGVYVHTNNKIAVLVTLLCETDFVARNEKFQQLARNLAMHIAAMDPIVVKPEDISTELIQAEQALAQKQTAAQGKPAEIQEKIVAGKVKKFSEEHALLTQPYVKDPRRTVQDIVQEAVQELGENITVKEFARLVV